MIDLMALLAPPTGNGGPSLPGLAVGREQAGFDAVLDQVAAQITALLVPAAPQPTPADPNAVAVPTPAALLGHTTAGETSAALSPFGFASPKTSGKDENTASEAAPEAPIPRVWGDGHPAAVDMPGDLPTQVSAFAPPVSGVPASWSPEHAHPAPKGPADEADVIATSSTGDPLAGLVAAVRTGLGLPSPVSPPPAAIPPGTTDKGAPALPDHAVAVGRTGAMPTLPTHAAATLPTPTGITRRFPVGPETPEAPGVPGVPTSPEAPLDGTAAPEASAAPAALTAPVVPTDAAPAAPAANEPVVHGAPLPSALDATAPVVVADAAIDAASLASTAPVVVADAPIDATPLASAPPVVDHAPPTVVGPAAATGFDLDVALVELPDAVEDIVAALPGLADAFDADTLRDALGLPAPAPSAGDAPDAVPAAGVPFTIESIDSVVSAPTTAAGVPASGPVDTVPAAPDEVPNDIAVPDVPPAGVPVDETDAALAQANADHTPVPVFDDAPPTAEERLSAIAPPLISSSEEAADNNGTTDTVVAPHDTAAPPAAAVDQAARAARPDRAEHRSDRAHEAHEANGLTAPLRAALRDRAERRRDDSFELTVRLDPPELGAVRVRVFTQGDNVRVTLHADSPEARTVLQQRHDDVRDVLRNEGFNLDGFDVETNDNRREAAPEQSRRRHFVEEFEAPPTFEDDGALRL